MSAGTPRLRMLAGPNGSGKSTLKEMLRSEFGEAFLGVDVNPDEIELHLKRGSSLSISEFGLKTTTRFVRDFFGNHPLAARAGLADQIKNLNAADGAIEFGALAINSYTASITSALLRTLLLEQRGSFTVETVMSSPDKVELLKSARSAGYRTYLYFVATGAPAINVARVATRVEQGGHDVPVDKIVQRYERCLELLPEAIRATDRAYVFDNSSDEPEWIAEVTGGNELEIKADSIPAWFRAAVLDKMAT